MRSDMNERIVVIISNSPKPAKVNLKLPSFLDAVKLVDLVNGKTYYPERNSVTAVLDKYGYAYLKVIE